MPEATHYAIPISQARDLLEVVRRSPFGDAIIKNLAEAIVPICLETKNAKTDDKLDGRAVPQAARSGSKGAG